LQPSCARVIIDANAQNIAVLNKFKSLHDDTTYR
jgi:hypothetical protein